MKCFQNTELSNDTHEIIIVKNTFETENYSTNPAECIMTCDRNVKLYARKAMNLMAKRNRKTSYYPAKPTEHTRKRSASIATLAMESTTRSRRFRYSERRYTRLPFPTKRVSIYLQHEALLCVSKTLLTLRCDGFVFDITEPFLLKFVVVSLDGSTFRNIFNQNSLWFRRTVLCVGYIIHVEFGWFQFAHAIMQPTAPVGRERAHPLRLCVGSDTQVPP